MITSTPQPSFDDLANTLEQMAQTLATAQVQTRAVSRGNDPIHWGVASLVWPLFTSSLMKKPKG